MDTLSLDIQVEMSLNVGYKSQECRSKIRVIAIDLGVTGTLVVLDEST